MDTVLVMNHLYTTFRLSKPNKRNWSSVFGYKPINDRSAMELGGMYAILSLASEIDFSLDHIGGMIFDELQQAYFGEEDGSASMQRFEQTLHAVKRKIELILDQEEKLAESGVDLQMSVVVFRDNVLYAAVVGEAHIFVQRESQLNEISGVLADPDMDGFMRSGSLRLNKGDRVLLATDNIDSDNSFSLIQEDVDKVQLESLNVSRGAILLIGYHAEPELQPIVATEAEVNIDAVSSAEPIDEELNLANIDNDIVAAEVETLDVEQDIPEVSQSRASRIKLPNFGFGRGTTAPVASDVSSSVAAGMPAVSNKSAVRGAQMEHHIDSDTGMVYTPMREGMSVEDVITTEEDDIETEMENQSIMPGSDEYTDDYANYDLPAPTNKVGAVLNTVKEKLLAAVKAVVALIASVDWKGLAMNIFNLVRTIIARLRGQNTVYAAGARGVGLQRMPNYRRNRMAYDPRRKRLAWAAAIVIGVVIILGIRQTSLDNERRSQITALEQQVNRLGVDIEQLKLDAETAANSSQAEVKQQVVTSASSIIAELKQLAGNELATPEIKSKSSQLQNNAQTAADRALKVKAIAQAQIVNNLAANFPGADPADLEIVADNLYVADKARNVVYRMQTQLGSQASAVLADLTQPYLLTKDTQNNLVVIDKNAQSTVGVMTVSNNNFRRVAGLGLSVQGELSGANIWTNRALYTLNPSEQAIVRQVQVGQNYETPKYSTPWRRDPEFAQAIDMEVDYEIYVLIKGVGLKRYFNGQPNEMVFRGLLPSDETAMRDATAFKVTPTMLFVADSVNQRILVFSADPNDAKSFDYVSTYVYRGDNGAFKNIKEIVVKDDNSQLFLLAGTSVIRIDL